MTQLIAALGVIAISFSPVFVRLAGVSPVTAAFFRAVYALPMLAVVLIFTRRPDPRRGRARLLAAASGVALACDLGLWHESIALIGVGLATVLANVQVVFLPLAGWLIYKERPSRPTFIVGGIVATGMVLASGLSRADAFGANPGLGVVFGAVAGLCYCVYLMVFRATAQHGVPPAPLLLDATIGIAVGSLLIAPFDAGFSLRPAWPSHGWILALALVTQVFGWLAITSALPQLQAAETSILLMLQPVFAVIWGFVFFSERLSPIQWTGAVMVLAGVAAMPRRT
jgi:drug/metabolite transporter (DMT)-like permease